MTLVMDAYFSLTFIVFLKPRTINSLQLSLELSRSEIGELNPTQVPNMEKNRIYMPKYTTKSLSRRSQVCSFGLVVEMWPYWFIRPKSQGSIP
jgi:hypothetical protein